MSSISGVSSAALNMNQSQATWDAIASIKSNSPFADAGSSSTGSDVAATLDAMLPGYGTMTSLDAANAAASASGGTDSLSSAISAQVQAAQQSTIDLYA